MFIYYIEPVTSSVHNSNNRMAVSLVSAQPLSRDGRKNSMKFALDKEVVYLDKNEIFKTLLLNIRQNRVPRQGIEGDWITNIFIEQVRDDE